MGDIHNYGVDELMNMSREQLNEELLVCRARLADVRRRLLFNWRSGWMLLGAIACFSVMLTGSFFTHPQLLFGSILFGEVLPMLFYIPLVQRFGPMIPEYKLGIQKIEFVLHRRGWM